MPYFSKLEEAYAEIADLNYARALLSWDEQTYMPPLGAEARGHQVATLSGIIHEKLTNPLLGDHIEATNRDSNDPTRRAWIRELVFDRERALKVPSSLVRELALEGSHGFHAWREARAKNDFSLFAPNLKRLVELKKQQAECYGYRGTPWNALVENYERGASAAWLTEIFAPLRKATVSLLDKIRGARQPDISFLEGKWNIDAQREFGLRVIRDLGYNMEAGRQDIAPHPFSTTIGQNDVRITTRFSEDKLLDAMLSSVHEAGHAMYEQGIDPEYARSPLFDGVSLGVHESQSRFWEVRIARSRPFWEHYLPALKREFPGQLDGASAETFYAAANHVQPNLIRVESDEVCYNLHVIIRFELELRIMNNQLSVDDLPEAWNALYSENLGVKVPDNARGCLQDIHWSDGTFGYFPTYTLGNVYTAMLTRKMEGDMPAMWDQVRAGEFGEILGWLRENIHRHGRSIPPRELIEGATGESVSAQPLIDYLETKYGELYGVG